MLICRGTSKEFQFHAEPSIEGEASPLEALVVEKVAGVDCLHMRLGLESRLGMEGCC